ncbi:MAG: DUF4263 domain-containing protein [Fimbriimonadaceae bacterium]|nr:DUF4263 domain-containing protein [Fimbriimonadaceae bacterium]
MRLPWAKPISKAEPVSVDLDGLKSKYRTESSSADTMEFEPIKLEKREPTEQSRKILRATAIRNKHSAKDCLKIRLIYQKKHNKGSVPEGQEFENLTRIKLSSLTGGQEVQVDLDSSQTAQLAEHIQNLYAIASEGITYGSAEKVIFSGEDSAFLEQLESAIKGSRERSDQVLAMVRGLDPAAFDVAAHKARHDQHVTALREFADHLEAQDWREDDWEAFFARNRWIFGHGLAYQFLSEVQAQPHYGGVAVDGKGAQRGDHLMATEAGVRFTVLVEVKTPQAPLTQRDEYRNGAFAPGNDVAGGVAQLQVNARKWAVEGAAKEENRDLEDQGVYTVQPKGILIVGHTASLDSRSKRTSFELYRQNLHNPEVITFDELFERAKFIVEHDLQSAPGESP